MKRIVWVAVTILIMIAIMGVGLHTLNRIEDANQQRREQKAGEDFASKITVETETTSIWEKVRASQDAATETPAGESATDENGQPMTVPVQTGEDGQSVTDPAQTGENGQMRPAGGMQNVPDETIQESETVAIDFAPEAETDAVVVVVP